MSEERIQLIIEWLERNPEYAKSVEKKLTKLNTAYETAKKALIDYNVPMAEQGKQYNALKEVYAEYATRMMKTYPAFRMFTEAQQQQQEQMMAGVLKWGHAGKQIEAFGRKVGFTGFIVTFSIQRIIRTLSQFVKYFTDSIKATAEWPDKLADVAYAMGMLQYTGLATADTQRVLADTMQNLITQGPKVEALWVGLQAVWTSVQTSLATALIPALIKVLDYLSAFLATKETQVAIANLGVAIGYLFESLVTMAPMIIQVVTIFAQLLAALKPFYPILVPLVATMLVLGMVCSVLGPIFTLLGAVIGTVVKMKMFWLTQTKLNTVAMHQLKLSIVSTIGSLAILGLVLWGLSRAATASATDISKSFDTLASSGTKMEWTITDANGNIMYTINTLDNTVKDASGNIVGYYDSMLGVILDNNNSIIGSLDETGKKFTGAAGEVGKLDKGMSDLAGALAKGFDTTALNKNLEDMMTSTDGLADSMGALQLIMVAFAGIQFAGLATQILSIASAIGGLGGSIAILGSNLLSFTGLIPGLSVLSVPGTIRATTPEESAAMDKAWKKYTEQPWYYQLPFVKDIAKALGYEPYGTPGGQFGIKRVPKTGEYRLEKGEKVVPERVYGPTESTTPLVERFVEIQRFKEELVHRISKVEESFVTTRGQFGIPSIPKTGSYRLEKGERVKATREYGPTETEPITTIVTETPQLITITNYISVGQLSTELDAEKLADIINRREADAIRKSRP